MFFKKKKLYDSYFTLRVNCYEQSRLITETQLKGVKHRRVGNHIHITMPFFALMSWNELPLSGFADSLRMLFNFYANKFYHPLFKEPVIDHEGSGIYFHCLYAEAMLIEYKLYL